MIKANELRIGNWVLAYGVEILIFSIAPKANGSKYGFNLVEGKMPSFYDHECEPIPLTPEILERCGFKRSGSNFMCIRKNHKEFGVYINGVMNCFSFKTCVWNGEELKYLHQLQNLYHALTGEELATPTPPTPE